MSAPFSISRVTVSVLPDLAASISGDAPVVVRDVGRRARGNQRRHRRGVSGLAGQVQRRVVAEPRGRADIGARRQAAC